MTLGYHHPQSQRPTASTPRQNSSKSST
jgi:hypothetical protein